MTQKPGVILNQLWNSGNPQSDPDTDELPQSLRDAIVRCINSTTKSYRYVLPTQLLAKLTDPSLDARAVQGGASSSGSFDARSFCHTHIVPFDRANHNVLGGSPEPYVNNPLRIPAINLDALSAQRNKNGFQDLITVLDFVEDQPDKTAAILNYVLHAIQARMTDVHIVYPVPNRATAHDVSEIISSYLTARTGGRRLQAVAAALFDSIGTQFGVFDRVNTGHINRADSAAGDVADLDCVDESGNTVLAVEVKDRRLTIREVQDKLPTVRARGVAEVLYVIRGGLESGSEDEFEKIKRREFAAGHNLYHIEFESLLATCMILFGETGRREFQVAIGERIDEFGELLDRKAWREALSEN